MEDIAKDNKFITELAEHQILEHEVVADLIIEWQQSNDIKLRDQIVLCHMRLIIQYADQYSTMYSTKGITKEELIMPGMIGVIEAMQRFDRKFKTRFNTYAPIWIKKEILQYIKDNSNVVRIPVYAQNDFASIPSYALKGSNNLDDVRSERKCSDNSGIQSIGDPLSSKKYAFVDDSATLEKGMSTLTPIELNVVHMYYVYDMKFSDIGRVFGFTRGYARQVKESALNKFRAVMSCDVECVDTHTC